MMWRLSKGRWEGHGIRNGGSSVSRILQASTGPTFHEHPGTVYFLSAVANVPCGIVNQTLAMDGTEK